MGGTCSAYGGGERLVQGNISGNLFCWRLSRPQDHSAAGGIISVKNSIDIIGNRTRDLPACGAEHQPTAAKRSPVSGIYVPKL